MRTSILTPPESADLQDPARQPAAAADLPSAATGIPGAAPPPPAAGPLPFPQLPLPIHAFKLQFDGQVSDSERPVT